MDYRQRLRALREDNDLTQAQAGRIIGKSQQGYNHIEAGRAELKIEDLVSFCLYYNVSYYNVSADYMVGLSDYPQSLSAGKRAPK